MSVDKNTLQNYVDRISRLYQEKMDILTEIQNVYNEAKANDINIKVLKKIINMIVKNNIASVEEEDELLEEYKSILGL